MDVPLIPYCEHVSLMFWIVLRQDGLSTNEHMAYLKSKSQVEELGKGNSLPIIQRVIAFPG